MKVITQELNQRIPQTKREIKEEVVVEEVGIKMVAAAMMIESHIKNQAINQKMKMKR
jgi:hypothetical protein